nr:methyl-accepting chemotaxis protein [uncultured Ralstonia sp.]
MFASIRIKIQVTCVTIVVCALVLAGCLNYLVTHSHNEKAIQKNLQAVANGHATGIDDWIASKLQLILALQDVALSDDSVPVFQAVAKAGGLIKVYAGYPDKSYKFSNPEGIPPTYDPTARPWYKQAVDAGKPVVTPPYVSASTGQLVVTFAVPILRDGGLKGVIGGDVAMDSVIANVKAIHPTPASFGFVVNAAGKIVAHPDDKLTLKPVTDLSAGLNEATLAALAQADKPVEVDVNGAAKLLYRQGVKGTDWGLVVALDKSDATAGMRSLVLTSAGALVAVAFVAALIVGAMTSRAFRRLSMIRDAMDDIGSGSGDLTKRLPSDGEDEVAQIARSFNTFADKLTAVMQQIRLGSDSVRSAAQEIAAGNADLSQRTEEQASALQQTAASMDELGATVRNNVDNAMQANQLAQNASNVAVEGGQVVRQEIAEEAGVGVGIQRDQLLHVDLVDGRSVWRLLAGAVVNDIAAGLALAVRPDGHVVQLPLFIVEAAEQRLLPPAFVAVQVAVAGLGEPSVQIVEGRPLLLCDAIGVAFGPGGAQQGDLLRPEPVDGGAGGGHPAVAAVEARVRRVERR